MTEPQNSQPSLKVQVWAYLKRQNETYFLILETQPDRGAFWQPVTGGVEKNEPVRDGALRELYEETGFTPANLIDLQFSFKFESRWGGQSEEHAFAAEIGILNPDEDLPTPKLDPKEHQSFKWVKAAEAMQRIRFSSGRQVLQLILDKQNHSGDSSDSA